MRDEIKEEILEHVEKGNSVLLKGVHGIGKSYMMRQIWKEKEKSGEIWIYFPYCKPPKQILLRVIQRLIPEGRDSERWKEIKRGTMLDLVDEIKERLEKRKLIIMLDEIHTLTATAASHYYELMQDPRIVFLTGGTSKYLNKKFEKAELKRFLWDLKQVEMPALSREESEELIRELYKKYKIPKTISTERVKRWILQNAGGNPLGIERAVEDLSRESDLNGFDIRKHGAVQDVGVNLFPVFVILLMVVVAWRFLARGAGDIDLYALTGFFGIIFYALSRFLMYRYR